MEAHDPDIIDVFQKCLSGIFFKNSAEIFPAESEISCRIIQCQRFPVMFPHPVHSLNDPKNITMSCFLAVRCQPVGIILIKAV